jgi:hypothetical protein
MDIPCGQNSDGHFYDCHGATSELIGKLSTGDSKNAPAYQATVGNDPARGLDSVATNLFYARQRSSGVSSCGGMLGVSCAWCAS